MGDVFFNKKTTCDIVFDQQDQLEWLHTAVFCILGVNFPLEEKKQKKKIYAFRVNLFSFCRSALVCMA